MTHKPYLIEPGYKSCYEYLLGCYERISADVGDYAAFVNLDCTTMMSKMFEDVEKLASFLVAQGIRRGDVLTVFLPTSPHAFIIFYALSKIGAVADFVPPFLPPAALKEERKEVGSKGIFILDRMHGSFAGVIGDDLTVICSYSDYADGEIRERAKEEESKISQVSEGGNVIRFLRALSSAGAPVPTVKDPGRDPAIYLHGSGTTGKSKTVVLSALALNNVAYGTYRYKEDLPHTYGNSYSLCILPCFHSFGISSGIHFCTCNNFSGIIMPKFDAYKANDYISRYNVQYISGAPSMFMKMLDQDNFNNSGVRNLEVLYTGGDIVSESFVEKMNGILESHGSRARLFRGWGLTEMGGACTTNYHNNCKPDSIGKCRFGVSIKVIDENGDILPANENGELCVTSDSVMNGYFSTDVPVWNNGVHVDENGTRWVHTGDMGYVDEDGYVFFTGRKKRIIIISAYNIYPYSIEQKIMTLPFINEACAVQGYDEEGKPLVKLCISLKPTDMSEDEVKEKVLRFCEENFESFSVPRKIVIMDALPRTKLAKLDFMSMSDKAPK